MKQMKKISLLLVICMLMASLFGCGAPKTLEDALAKANKKVEKWNSKTEATCSYRYAFLDDSNTYLVYVKSLTVEDDTDSYKEYIAEDRSEFVYEELKSIFENFPDVAIGVAMENENGKYYYLTRNGEVLFNGLD